MVAGAGTYDTFAEEFRLESSYLVECASDLVRSYNLKIFSLEENIGVVDVREVVVLHKWRRLENLREDLCCLVNGLYARKVLSCVHLLTIKTRI